jgi:L,D-peptidoglycan transpeptidase YkuD (ErfK/YbiS/YcfS/YnhG family)
MASRLGRTGVTSSPSEADGSTPAGTYAIQYAFGRAESVRSALPYLQTTADDHWIDDPASPYYNTWQTGDPDGRWDSAEDLDGYALAVVFDFNQHPVVPGANSAIFLHAGTDAPSAGCVTVSSDDLATLVAWLDPAKSPHITIGIGAAPPAGPAV